MTLAERLAEYVRACFTGLWIQSHEHDEAIAELGQLCRREKWRLASWDVDRGLQITSPANSGVATDGGGDPLAAIRALSSLASENKSALLVLVNFHRFLNSAEIVQALAHQVSQGKQNRTFVVILSPIVQIPTELEKLFVVIEHDLPSREQLAEIARGVATEAGELPDQSVDSVLDSAAGLTRYEAENAFALSLVRHRRIEPTVVFEQKSQMLKKNGLLTLYQGQETFGDLGGLESLKAFCTRSLRQSQRRSALTRPRGVLLLSPPGCGKSAFAKSLGNETGRPTLVLDVGGLLGSLVGQSEQNVRQALRIADAMAPCILFCDEIEKGAQRYQRPRGLGCVEPAIRHALDLSERPYDGRLFHRHVERHQSAATGVRASRTVRWRVHDRSAGPEGAGDHLADVPAAFWSLDGSAATQGHRLDRCGDSVLLPVSGVARCSADRSSRQRGPGRDHCRRVGREAAELGRGSVPFGRQCGRLLPWADRNAKTGPASKPWRSVQ